MKTKSAKASEEAERIAKEAGTSIVDLTPTKDTTMPRESATPTMNAGSAKTTALGEVRGSPLSTPSANPQKWSTPAMILENCVEYAKEVGHPESLTLDICPEDVTQWAMLDSDLIESMDSDLRAPAYSGVDMYTALKIAQEDSKAIQKLRGPMKKLGNRTEKIKKLISILELKLDEELKSYDSGSFKGGTDLISKAAILARERSKNSTKAPLIQHNYSRSKHNKKYEFQVHLTRLVGGHGGCLTSHRLFFGYNDSFNDFLSILQDATQLCTIPPTDFTLSIEEVSTETATPKPYYPGIRRRTLGTGLFDTSSQGRRWTTPISEHASTVLENKKVGSEPRDPSVKGYILEDGPWTWRLLGLNSDERFPLQEVENERDYLKMVDLVKERNNINPRDEYAVLVIHSMDEKMKTKWEDKIQSEQEHDERARKIWMKDNGIREGDEEDLPESWLDWSAKQAAKERAEKGESYYF